MTGLSARRPTFVARPWLQRAACVFIMSCFMTWLCLLAGTGHGARTLLASLLIIATMTLCGEWILARASLRLTSPLPAAWVVGAAVTMLATWALSSTFGMTAAWAFAPLAGLTLLAWLWKPIRSNSDSEQGSWFDVLAIAVLSILIACFCRDVAAFQTTVAKGGSLPAWSDYYVHGTAIASFGDPLAISRGNILLADTPRPLYHYGTYALAAAWLSPTDLPGLALALCALLPLGLLIGALGLYAWVAQLTNKAIALATVVIVACLPDAAAYGMENGFFGVRWLLYTAPGTGYALGVAAMAAACVTLGLRSQRRAATALGFALLASLVAIRLHFFVLLAPALAGTWLLGKWRTSGRTQALAVGGAFIVALCAAAALLALQPSLKSLFLPLPYMESTLGFGIPHLAATFHAWVASGHEFLALLIGPLLMLVAALGIWVLILPVMTIIQVRRRRWETADWLPWLLCATYTGLILLAPTLNTDSSELRHRHFVLMYAIVVAWCFARAGECLPTFRAPSAELASLGVSVLLVLVVMVVGRDARLGLPSLKHMPWATDFYGRPIAPGIAQAGTYLREHSQSGDILATSGQAMRGYMQSRQTELVSFADVPTYLGRVELLEKQDAASATLARERSAVIDGVVNADDWPGACARLAGASIRWFVVDQPHQPTWDPDHHSAVFQSGTFAIYDAGPAAARRCPQE
ncbi:MULTISPECIES: hypothetical protein [Dyella]|uniref:Uncharacterized protein n=2 Tax=Dyella TaxID=231454 RepID=A0A4R0YLT0_9GAMM|nr:MULTISPECIES: hypothetical protein [Dyella]TBR36490.1 hypothetical protein EYV96_11160 [Dyella terrae]TCI08418.1 hypothetical protein EZM97_27710 [Dyella soli]